MPRLRVNGAELFYEDTGGTGETIVFAHGLLWSGRMFDAQVAALRDRYRCVTFDFRGQGKSEVTQGGYDMDTLAEDARELIGALDCAPCHFLGLSMGGFIGQRLAVRHPSLLRSLILVETSAGPEPEENIGRYNLLNFVARLLGFRFVVGRVMPIMFGDKFLNSAGRRGERELWRGRLIKNDRIGTTRAVRGVVRREGMMDRLREITVPTLIIVGNRDTATVPERSEEMHEAIEGSRLVVIPDAGHTSTVEEPEAVNEAIESFLEDTGNE